MPGICSKCNNQIVDLAPFASCTRCRKSYHPACVNLGTQELDFLKETKGKWTCPACSTCERQLRSKTAGCRSPSPLATGNPPPQVVSSETTLTTKHFDLLMEEMRKMTASLERVERRQDGLMARLDECNAAINSHTETLISHQTDIDSCKSHITTIKDTQMAVSASVSFLTGKISELESRTSSGDVSKDTIVPEVTERVKRSFNLIVSNVPESDSTTDSTTISEICELISVSSSTYITSVVRLQSKDVSRPRWIKVSFSNPEIVQTILRRKSSILGNSQFRAVKIQDDKTKEQLSHLTSLREELKSRLAAGEADITIKYIKGTPRIVNTLSSPKSVNSKN